jgi:hypothetical protein
MEIKNLQNADRKITKQLGPFSVLEYMKDLSVSPFSAASAYFMEKMGVRRKQVICSLKDSLIRMQAGALQWMTGNIQMETDVKGAGDFLGKMVKGAVTKESAVKPVYKGTGIVALEPTYKYLIPINVGEWEGGVTLEDGMYLVSEGSVQMNVVSRKNGTYSCTTKLLGEHNVQNIVGAIAIAEYLELTKEQIINGVSKIEPVEHRLQLLPSANGTTVIDDAFNSNPVGSKAALDVISQFKGRKIIITPGMVELGAEEDKYNKEFGKQMARVIDIAILVGQNHTKPIQEGLKEAGFDDMSIYVVSSLDEATAKLAKLTKAGDVILFENDLPDSYNE